MKKLSKHSWRRGRYITNYTTQRFSYHTDNEKEQLKDNSRCLNKVFRALWCQRLYYFSKQRTFSRLFGCFSLCAVIGLYVYEHYKDA